jgi:lysophospholipase L1-like esterase
MNPIQVTKTLAALGLAGAALLGCKPQLDAPAPTAGTVDFSRYVAVGNSLTAGYADNGLYRTGQLNSYPNILAGQLRLAGGAAEFRQPLFPESQSNGTGYLILTGLNNGVPSLTSVFPQAIRGQTTPDPLHNPPGVLLTRYNEPIDNYGIPNIRVADLNDPQFARNPYYERILTDAEVGNKTYLAKVTESNPTFFSCWLGNNDVLLFAVSGGQVPITPPAAFNSLYTELIAGLTQNGAGGAVANISDVTTIPFLTTLSEQAKGTLTQLGVPALIIQTGPATSPVVDTILTSSIYSRAGGTVLIPLTASPYLPLVGRPGGRYWRDFARSRNLPVAAVVAGYNLDTTQVFGGSPRNPLPTSLILDAQEVSNASAAVQAYNTIIGSVANARGLALVDANALLRQFQTGILYNGVGVNAAFISGGLFSLDGVHLTPRGYAITANEFIKAINGKYGSTIPQVDVNNYPGVRFP